MEKTNTERPIISIICCIALAVALGFYIGRDSQPTCVPHESAGKVEVIEVKDPVQHEIQPLPTYPTVL